MTGVVLGESEARVPVDARIEGAELAAQARTEKELVAQPDGHRPRERAQATRRDREIRLDQALELEERLLVVRDKVEIGRPDAGALQTERDGMSRIVGIVPEPRKPLFLSGRHDHPIVYERGRTIVIVRRDPEDLHTSLEQGVNEWRDGRALREDEDGPEHDEERDRRP